MQILEEQILGMETTILMDFRYISDIRRRKQYEEIREKHDLSGSCINVR